MKLSKEEIEALLRMLEGIQLKSFLILGMIDRLEIELNRIKSNEKHKITNDSINEIRKEMLEKFHSNFKVCCCPCCKKDDG